MKFIFKYAFIAIALSAYYICTFLYILAHILFVGDLQYDKSFVCFEHISHQETDTIHHIYVYKSIAHKFMGVAKAQYHIPKNTDK